MGVLALMIETWSSTGDEADLCHSIRWVRGNVTWFFNHVLYSLAPEYPGLKMLHPCGQRGECV